MARDASRIEFTKHMIRLRHRDQKTGAARRLGDVFPEVVLVNANDGSSSYVMSAGLFRRCGEGLSRRPSRVQRTNRQSPPSRVPSFLR